MLPGTEPLAIGVNLSQHALHVVLADGREVSAPLTWFPRLSNATEREQRHWRLIGSGIGVHWPDIDEDISIERLPALQ